MNKENNAKTEPRAILDGVPVFCAFDEVKKIEELKPHPKNPNQHSESQIELLGRVIRQTGWRAPITVSNLSGYIIKGHGRLMAARQEGIKEVPVEYQDFKSTDEELAALVADNRIAELSYIDQIALRDVFKDIDLSKIPAELTGYTEEEFKDIADIFANVDPAEAEEGPEDFDDVTMDTLAHKCPRCGFEFDD